MARRITVLVWAAVALAAVVGASAVGAASEPPPIAGTIYGSTGGAEIRWDVDWPPGQEVTLLLAHDPCLTRDSIIVEAYGPAGQLATSHEVDACHQGATFNTVAGGKGFVKLVSYRIGETKYVLKGEGIDLAVASPPEGAPEDGASDEEAAAGDMVEEDGVPPEADASGAAVPVPPAATDPSVTGVFTSTLVGDAGGAYKTYTMPVVAGTPYEFVLDYTMASGGSSWTGVGIETWAPTGTSLGTSTEKEPLEHRLQFIPAHDMDLTVKVFNYQPGQQMRYTLQGLVGGREN